MSIVERPGFELHALLSQVAALVWSTDRDLRIVSVEGRAAERLGLDDGLGRTIGDYFPEDAAAFRVHRAALAGKSGQYDHVALGAPWRVWTEPLRDEAGQIVGTVSVALDMSEQLASRTLVEALPLVVYTASLDDDARPVFIAPQVRELLGVDPETFTFDLLRQRVHPDDRRRVEQLFDRADQDKSDLTLEYRWIRPDGRMIWLEDASRVVDTGDQPLAQGYLLDITARKQTETTLGRRTSSRQRLAALGRRSLEGAPRAEIVGEALAILRDHLAADVGAILESGPDGLVVVDGFGWEAAGAVAREGTPAYAARKQRATVAGHTTPASPDSLLARAAMASTVAAPILCDGWECFGVVAVHARAAGAFDEGDVALVEQVANMIGAVVARERVDARTQMSQRLEAVGQLAAGIAHDFNNMLTVISGYTAFALGHCDPAGRAQLEHVLHAAERAGSLTTQLLAFSRQQMLQRRPVALGTAVRDTVRMLRATLGENIAIVESGEDAVVLADEAQLENVLVNLAVNARDAMPDGGTLTIRRETVQVDEPAALVHEVAPGAYGVLEVADTGIGMAPEVRARIFDPFFTTKEIGKGTGLGLAGVYGTIRQSGGFVTVDSAPGEGAVFRVHLPLAADCEEAAERGAEAEGPGPARILLVEDEEIVRSLLAEQLRLDGHRVVEAATAPDALHLAEGGRFDVVLSDVGLPGIDGATLAETIRARHRDIAVVLMSGYPGDRIRAARSLDGVPLLQKPFSAADLRQALGAVLG